MVGVADKFPTSLPEFQRMFPDDAACGRYLENVRWREGFVCPRCNSTAEHGCIPRRAYTDKQLGYRQ